MDKLGHVPRLKGCAVGSLGGGFSPGGGLLPEEALAALTGQGVEMVACGSVPAHHTAPRPILSTGHGFRCFDGCRRPLDVGRVSTLDALPPFWATSS